MNTREFSQRFNKELSLLGFPEEITEKTKAVSKVFGVTRHLANAMIFGNLLPSLEQLDRIAEILEVCPRWLGGETSKKKAYDANQDLSGLLDNSPQWMAAANRHRSFGRETML